MTATPAAPIAATTLPLLLGFDLTDRQVLAVGGGPVSARRVGDLLEAGAKVHLVAPYACEDVVELAAQGRITWSERDVLAADLDDVWLVHTATGDSAIDSSVREWCERRKIWCVDATDAAATRVRVPARRHIDTPDGAIQIAVLAGDPGRSRTVVNGLRDQVAAGQVELRRQRPRSQGWVALLGGGPGDDGLLTERARVLLRAADVVVHDRLAPQAVLRSLPDTVELIDVGKTPGRHPVPQHEINQILVDHAQAGRGVVRLKGGDPYVLGRGGEERLACAAAGVQVEVVPGVTSAIAVPAAAGIPVTHRGIAAGFTVITGHEDIPRLPGAGDHTVVVLMGVSTLARTAELLVKHGRPAGTPVAVIERGCTPQQRVTIGTLDDIALRAQIVGVESPAVTVVGEVVTLAD